jgi:hypothetical protein
MAIDLMFSLAIYERLIMEAGVEDVVTRSIVGGIEPSQTEYALLDRLWQISVMRSVEWNRRCHT